METFSTHKHADYSEIMRQAERERARVLREIVQRGGAGLKSWAASLFGAAPAKTGRTA